LAQASLADRTLRSALSDATRLGLVPFNAAARARPALRTPRKRAGFTRQEAQAIIAAAGDAGMAPLFAFMLCTWLRLGGGLGLRWNAVDLQRVAVRTSRDDVGSRMVEGTPKASRSTCTVALLTGAACRPPS